MNSTRQSANARLTRIGVFYDGGYFFHVSQYYNYHHERRARISISGLHRFVKEEVAKREQTDPNYCQIVDAHYFRGRLSASAAQSRDSLYKERVFENVLIHEGVTTHFLPLYPSGEKGIDVWFSVEAFELAVYKRFDVSVLVTGDGDYVPLARKLNTLGTRVMLLAWDLPIPTMWATDSDRSGPLSWNRQRMMELSQTIVDSGFCVQCPERLNSAGTLTASAKIMIHIRRNGWST